MKKYELEVERRFYFDVTVEAESPEDAVSIVEDLGDWEFNPNAAGPNEAEAPDDNRGPILVKISEPYPDALIIYPAVEAEE